MRRTVSMIACAVLAGCTDGEIKDAVKDNLIDPESARFGEISYSASGDMACAEVNSKNQMGGYTGKRQVYLRRVKGEWMYVLDRQEPHEACVSSMNYTEEGDGESAADTSSNVDSLAVENLTAPDEEGVSLVAEEPVWVQISDGPKTLFAGELDAGQRYRVPETATDPRLRAAKPEALTVMVGSTEARSLGPPGRAVSNVSLKPDDLLK